MENGQYLPRSANFERSLEAEDRLDSMKISMARAMMRQETGDWRQERRKDKEKEEEEEEKGEYGDGEDKEKEGRPPRGAPTPPRRWAKDM